MIMKKVVLFSKKENIRYFWSAGFSTTRVLHSFHTLVVCEISTIFIKLSLSLFFEQRIPYKHDELAFISKEIVCQHSRPFSVSIASRNNMHLYTCWTEINSAGETQAGHKM